MNASKVVVFLATYNGQRFLSDQLDSLSAQSHKNWELWVSDDGSTDHTLPLLRQYQQSWAENSCFIHKGPRKGFAANFLSLACRSEAKADYYAFSDQDDCWHEDKLRRGLAWLETIPSARPALYCSKTKLIDEKGEVLGYSMHYKKPPTFANALVQNIAAGNTIMLNEAALNLLRAAGEHQVIAAHDWWIYLLVSGAGGAIFFDTQPTVSYRQHPANVLGSNAGWVARAHRIRRLFRGDFQKWNDLNTEALLSVNYLLTEENGQLLKKFILARDDSFFSRLIRTKQLGLYRQTFLGNMGLAVAAIFKKI